MPKAAGDILIAEGIETALSVAIENQDKRVIASTSVNNMININLPKDVRRVILGIDYDGDGVPEVVVEEALPSGRDFSTGLPAVSYS